MLVVSRVLEQFLAMMEHELIGQLVSSELTNIAESIGLGENENPSGDYKNEITDSTSGKFYVDKERAAEQSTVDWVTFYLKFGPMGYLNDTHL